MTEVTRTLGAILRSQLARWSLVAGLCGVFLAAGLYLYPFLYFLPYGKLSVVASGPIEFETSLEGLRFTGKTGNFIDDHIYFSGGWELFELHALRDFLQSTAGSDGVFLDIGANIGQHSLYMSRYAAKVIAIEPYPPVLERMRRLQELNRIENVHIYPVGYSNEEGALPFYAPPEDNLGAGSFDAAFSKEKRPSGYLPLVIGDRHLAAEGINRVDLVKVDIEGYERYALLGLAKTLRTSRPVVVFELNISEGGFRNREQFSQAFPPAYEFCYLEIDAPAGVGPFYSIRLGASHVYLFGPGVRGRYSLKPYDFSFNQRANLVAFPVEKAGGLKVNL